MPTLANTRQIGDLAAQFDVQRLKCERLGDTLAGIAILFAAAAALVLFAGWWTREPLLMASFGFAMAAAVGFAISARAISRARRAMPRIAEANAYVLLHYETKWRRAA